MSLSSAAIRDPVRMLWLGVRDTCGIPARYAVVLAVVHALVLLALGPLARLLILTAMAEADTQSLTLDNVPRLLSFPVSLILVAGTVAIVVCATFVLSATLFVVADLHLSGARPSLRALVARVVTVLRTLCRPESALLALTVCVFAPVAGFALFSPLTSGFALPPFIGREFAKTTLGSLGLQAAGVALVYLYFRTVLTFPLTVVTGRRPARTFLTSLSATGSGGPRMAVLLGLGYAVTWLVSRLATTMLGLAVDGLSVAVHTDILEAGARCAAGVTAVASSTLFGYLLVAQARRVAGLTSADPPASVRRTRPGRRALVAGTAVFGLLAGAVSTQIGARAVTSTPSDALVIAHRGYDSGGVENTIAALDAAVPFTPDFVEVDIQQTGDGGFVASHDTNLFVLAGVNRNIYEMSTAEVTSTTVRMKGNSDRIPSMTDYVRRAQELGQPLLIELKVTGHEKPGYVSDLLAELDSIDALESNMYHSLSAPVVNQITSLHPELRVGLILGLFFGAPPLAPGVDFYSIEQSSYSSEFVAGAHALGRAVYVWTVNDNLGMRRFLRDGADGLVTDRLTEANHYRSLINPQAGYSPGDARDELLAEEIWR
jgi:glycerophosphoryl diester phosphodiesterase